MLQITSVLQFQSLTAPRDRHSTVQNKRYLWICALFHLFREETNAGLQGPAIYFDLKDSLHTNPGVFSPGCTLKF